MAGHEQRFQTTLKGYLALATGPKHSLPGLGPTGLALILSLCSTNSSTAITVTPAAFGPSVWAECLDFLWLEDLGCPSGLSTNCAVSGSVCKENLSFSPSQAGLLPSLPAPPPPQLPGHIIWALWPSKGIIIVTWALWQRWDVSNF